jgi:copper chaperone CopZ
MKSIWLTLFSLIVLNVITTKAHAQQEVKNTTITVKNLTCNGDLPTIKKQLLKHDGILDVSFSPIKSQSSLFIIKYQDKVTTPTLIEKVIETTQGCDDKTQTPYRVDKKSAPKGK